MSGVVGIYNINGAPVSPALLHQMTSSLAYRGPDRQQVWVQNSVGFGHTLLATTREAIGECQPLTLDNQVWIVADARLDGRKELLEKLRARVRHPLATAPDSELILYAYHAWGEDCVAQLYGDFALAIWDSKRRSVFCARDQLGVKCFYYAITEGSFLFSNTLDCLRAHPGVSDSLNELAIADYLLFGFRQDPAATSFRDIQRLPPAHTLTVADSVTAPRRYWSPSPDRSIRYSKCDEYVGAFHEILRTAVNDRLRCDRAGIFLSGGMDSSAIAATVLDVCKTRGAATDLTAYTAINSHAGEDTEQYYSGLVANALKIPIDYLEVDCYRPFDRWDNGAVRGAELGCTPFAAISSDRLHRVETDGARVVLTGDGGDHVFYPRRNYFFDLLQTGRLWRMVVDGVRCSRTLQRIPHFGFRAGLRDWSRKKDDPDPMPAWIDADLSAKYNLPERWRHFSGLTPDARLASRPEAYDRLTSASVCTDFELNDPGVTFRNVEVRCPLFDVRLLNYLLAIPPVPWNFDKGMLRLAMRGSLPKQVRLRRKTPMGRDPLAAHLQRPGSEWIDRFQSQAQLADYVDRTRVPLLSQQEAATDLWTNIRPLTLNLWLQSVFAANQRTAIYQCAESL